MRLRVTALTVVGLLLMVGFNNCGKFKILDVPSSSGSLSSVQNATPILTITSGIEKLSNMTFAGLMERKCSGCHNAQLKLGNIENLSDVNYLITSNLVKFGDPENSRLYIAVKSGRMPVSGNKLTASELEVVRNFIATKGTPTFSSTLLCAQASANLSRPPDARLWPITKQQYANIILDTFGVTGTFTASLPKPIQVGGLGNQTNQMGFDDLLVSQFQTAAEQTTQAIVQNQPALARFWACNPNLSQTPARACVTTFIQNAGMKLFRRPLTTDEVTRLTAIYDLSSTATAPATEGVSSVLQTLLFSPNFIYRKELGSIATPGLRNLDHYQAAESLAFLLTDSGPDNELTLAASRGLMFDTNERARQIVRLLGTSRGKNFVARILSDYMNLESIENLALPVADPALLRTSIVQQFEMFVADAVASPNSVEMLYSSSDVYMNNSLATSVYNMTGFDQTFRKVRLSSAERSGYLTMPAFLVMTSALVGGKPTLKRGVFVREKVLCQKMGSPPPLDGTINTNLPSNFAQLSPREQFEAQHLKSVSCAGCHMQIDPVGFGMDQFTSLGQLVNIDPISAKPVDVKGFVAHTARTNFNFEGAAQLSQNLAKSSEVQECFAQNTVQYVIGKVLEEIDQCLLQRQQLAFLESGGDISKLIVNILNDPQFYQRYSQ